MPGDVLPYDVLPRDVLRRDVVRALLAYAVLPLLALVVAHGRAYGPVSVDLVWTLTRMWAGAHGGGYHTPWLDAPDGTGLLAMAGNGADVPWGALLGRWPLVAYDAYGSLWLWVAGLGGYTLGAVLGARRPWLAGLLLQLDPYTLQALVGGRDEHLQIGLAALVVAGAVVAWRGSWAAAVATGAGAALLVFTAQELAFFLALLSPLALVAAPVGGRSDAGSAGSAGWARLAVAVAVAAVLSAPFLALWASKPTAPSPGFGRWLAVHQSLGLVPRWTDPRPSLPLLLAIPAWAASQPRRVKGAVAVGAVVVVLLALGPSPSLGAPPPRLPWSADLEALDAPVAAWAPFTWLMSVVPRYQWPIRLLFPLGLLGAVAAADVSGRWSAKWGRRGDVATGVLVAWAMVAVAPTLAVGHMREPAPGKVAAAIARDAGGFVLDLPFWRNPAQHLDDHVLMLVHGRPIARSMQLFHLDPSILPRLEADPVAAWFLAVTGEAAPPPARFDRDDLEPWRAKGCAWVTLRQGALPADRWAMARRALAALGEPDAKEGEGLLAWRLRAPSGGPARNPER